MKTSMLEKLNLLQVTRPLSFSVGDTVKVQYKIIEGTKQRIQAYEGVVIAIKNGGSGKTFTVRRISFDVGVERIFLLNSPSIHKIEVVKNSKVKQAKLYYLREKIGKQGRLKEINRKPQEDTVYKQAEELRNSESAKTKKEDEKLEELKDTTAATVEDGTLKADKQEKQPENTAEENQEQAVEKTAETSTAEPKEEKK